MVIESKEQLSGCIDHTLLRASATEADIRKHCAEAVEYGFYSVCVLGRWVSLAADMLSGTAVKIDGVAGFPFGADTTKIKVADAEEVIMCGADEVDMVADLAAVMEGNQRYLANEFRAVLDVCRSMRPAVVLKVIIESAALSEEQIRFVCGTASGAGVDFVKTSTGLHPAGGATVEAVRLMAESAPRCKVKAAGGIRTAEQALAMIDAGAARIGASGSVAIVEGFTGGGQ